METQYVISSILTVILTIVVLWLGNRLFDRLSGDSERRRLTEVGLPASAKIISIERGRKTRVDGGRRYPEVIIEVAVNPRKGKQYEAMLSAFISEESIPKIQPGAKVPVRIDPDDPENLVLDADYFSVEMMRRGRSV